MPQEQDQAPEIVVEVKPRWYSGAPWWLVSAGLHVVLLLGAALLLIDRWVPFAGCPGGNVILSQQKPPVVTELERVRDVFERKGIPKDDSAAIPSDEPAIFFPEAKESDHNESADGEDYKQMKGDAKDFLSYIKGEAGGVRGRQAGKAPGVYDTMGIGVGGAGGGRYGGRFGCRDNLVSRGGGSKATEAAVLSALSWLARHQKPDGSWPADDFDHQCRGAKCSGHGSADFSVGVSALSLLSFLGAGYTPYSRDEFPDPLNPGRTIRFGDVVRNGMKWLVAQQDPEGRVGLNSDAKLMYNHALAALALSEGYGMTGAQALKAPAQRAVDFTVAAQNPGKGWRYGVRPGDNDSSVTGWSVMALKSAELSDLHFPRTAYSGARAWFDEASDRQGRVGYTGPGTGKVYVAGQNERFDHHETLTAIATMSRLFMDKHKLDSRLASACDLLLKDKPAWGGNSTDFYYWYSASLALFQFDGPDGPRWKAWNEELKKVLTQHQIVARADCRHGSWDAVDRWSMEGGRVYGTSLNALTLQVYYRYANVFGGAADISVGGRAPAPVKAETPEPGPGGMTFATSGIHPFTDTTFETQSTFGLDVDTASYTMARNYLHRNSIPPPEAIRVEEFLNYFHYDDPPPPPGRFAVRLEAAPSPFQTGRHLLRIAVQAPPIHRDDRKDAILTFVVDVSGSMSQDNRLGLVQRSMEFLVGQLRPTDRIGLVVYGTNGRKILDPIPVSRKREILEAIRSLATEGATNLEAGLDIGYDLASAAFDPRCTNRVVVCTDGVANNGVTDAAILLKNVKTRAAKGIWLSVLGFGMGNVNDALMEKLADGGNGNYAYIDDDKEAKKVFSDKLMSIFDVVAADAKSQVDFDPRAVSGFRFLGYEKRHLENKDFRNDKVDAGELGAGHHVTALYEVVLKPGARGRLATVRLRYRETATNEVVESEESLGCGQVLADAASASASWRLAASVACFAEILRASPHAAGISMSKIHAQAERAAKDMKKPEDVMEFLDLVRKADALIKGAAAPAR